jgi:gamma-glutamyltranspeptidase/glutathione hydrolase
VQFWILLTRSSTGIGGDCFCLFYDAASQTVKGLNGSGRAPSHLTLDVVKQSGFFDGLLISFISRVHFISSLPIGISGESLPPLNVHTITVPGAPAAWLDTLERFGTKSASEVLQGAIDLAEGGFPVQPIAAHFWEKGSHLLKDPVMQ